MTRVLSIAMLLLLLATSAFAAAPDSACHASALSSASDDGLNAPLVSVDHLSVADFGTATSDIATSHCASELVALTGGSMFVAPAQPAFEQMALPSGQGLLMPPEPQPPRL